MGNCGSDHNTEEDAGLFGVQEFEIKLTSGDVNNIHKAGKLSFRLHDVDGKKSEQFTFDVPMFAKLPLTQVVRCPLNPNIAFLEVFQEKRGCMDLSESFFLDIIHVVNLHSSSIQPFPFNRDVMQNFNEEQPLLIAKYDCVLPQNDKNNSRRGDEIEARRSIYTYKERIPGFAKLCYPLPTSEKFSHSYEWDRVIGSICGDLTSVQLSLLNGIRIERFSDYKKCYQGEFSIQPEGASNGWESDINFGLQRLTGVNPIVIMLCSEDPETNGGVKLPENFPVTDEILGNLLEGYTLTEAMKEKKIFIVDYSIYDGLNVEKLLSFPCACMGLFYENSKKQLMPVAIKLEQRDDAPIFTPNDTPYNWLLAKMYFNSADANYHESCSHLGFTHLISETMFMSIRRNLSPSHPISRLLEPHSLYLFAINSLAFDTLIAPNKFFDKVMGIRVKAAKLLMAKRWDTWKLNVDGCFINDLRRRGLNDTNVLSGYSYRNDGMLLHEAILKYVEEFLHETYGGCIKKMNADWELQNWARSLTSENEAGFKMENFTGFKDQHTLAMVLTSIIFTCSVQHAAVNFGQYDQFGFPPNCPTKIKDFKLKRKRDDLDEKKIVDLLPDVCETGELLTIMKLLSEKATKSLGYFEVDYLYSPLSKLYQQRFQDNLKKASNTIQERELERPSYDRMDPRFIPNAISI